MRSLFRSIKSKSDRIHTVAQTSRLRTVIKYVSKVRVTAGAFDLRSLFRKAFVHFFNHIFLIDRPKKARPTGAGFELCIRAENGQSARRAIICAPLVIVRESTAVRGLGPLAPHYVKLGGRQYFLPFVV